MKHSPGFLRVVEDALSRVREVTIEELDGWETASYVLIDVREDHEWAKGHLPEAVHLGRGILERDAEARWPEPATRLVLYCGGGYRSALAADMLQRMGYTDVWSLAGGWRRWGELGRPTAS